MSWRERLQPASFRGVPFQVEAGDATVGRRGETHEYPGRDTPYREDLGRRARSYALDAFLVGDDYLEQRDALLDALEQPGPATLVHPWFGSLQVALDGDATVRHRWDDGGYCVIQLSFVEQGEQRYPTRARDTTQALQQRADALTAAAVEAFQADFKTVGKPDSIAAESLVGAATVLSSVSTALSGFGGELQAPLLALQNQAAVWLGPTSQLGQFASAVSGLWGQLQDLSQQPLRLKSQISSMLSLVRAEALRPVGLWDSLSASSRQVLANINAVAALVRHTAVAETLRMIAAIPAQTPSAQAARPAVDDADDTLPTLLVGHTDLLDVRSQLVAVLDRESLRATSDVMFELLEASRLAAYSDLSERAAKAPRLITLTPPDVLPAVVLATRWQGDARRADELIARNAIKHPGFVPVEPLQVIPT